MDKEANINQTKSVEVYQRPRRLRTNAVIRASVQETILSTEHLVFPIFVVEGINIKTEINSMPGIFRFSLDLLLPEIKRIWEAGVRQIILFGIPDKKNKDYCGSKAWDAQGPVQKAIRAIKKEFPDLTIWADICLCEYTDHGHCGLLKDGQILNDETLPLLSKAALSCAQAGADGIAPSDMMDGRISFIRRNLNKAGYDNCMIMAYSAKFASAFYGPFREAADSAPSSGNRKSYQMNPANRKEAMREVRLDIEEGADLIMIKPAMAYLDIIREAADISDRPVVAYHVSGEYSMIKAASHNGWINEAEIVLEALMASRRAGASLLITYHAPEAAKWLKNKLQDN